MKSGLVLGCFALVLLGTSSLAFAQNQVAVNLTEFNSKGVFAGGRGNVIEMVLPTEQRWQIAIDSRNPEVDTVMELTADGARSLLQAGVSVRFETQLNTRRRPIGEVSRISIFSPTPDTSYSVSPGGANVGVDALGGEAEAGVEAPPKPAGEGETWFVVGKIQKAKDSSMTVQTAVGPLTVKLAEEVDVDVHLTDKTVIMNVLRPGDPLEVRGGYVTPPSALAMHVTARLTRKLGEDVAARRPAKPPAKPIDPKNGKPVEEKDVIGGDDAFGVPEGEAVAAPAEVPPAVAEPGKKGRILRVN